jgi:hypothetical protein
MNTRTAIANINRHGVLLVFPFQNRKEPASLWRAAHPRTPLEWEWNDDGDDRVPEMWLLMKRLSDCREVIYSKWYQGRATFFSRDLFRAMLAMFHQPVNGVSPLINRSRTAQSMFEALEMDSPLSTKELKRATDLQGKWNESLYGRGLKELFLRLEVVGFGEVDDGAFPSLAVGATHLLYEDLWGEAMTLSIEKAESQIQDKMPTDSILRKFFDKQWRASRARLKGRDEKY